jgi:tetratricopeptide (TPR) repeat protein
LVVGFLLAAATFAAFSPLLGADFISFDDPIYVTENARVQAGLTMDNVRWALTTTYFGFYYPLTWLSHMADCSLFGLWAGGHHLTSLLIHLANTLLLFGLLRRATGDFWPSALVAALFALHPLHVESVAWISERKDVLSTFFLMLALWAYVEYARRPGFPRYFVVMVLFFLGLASKSMIVTAPILMLIMDYWPLRRLGVHREARREPGSGAGRAPSPAAAPWGKLVLEKVPLLALSLVFVGVTLVAQASAVGSLKVVPLWTRLLNAVLSYGGYLAKMAVPVNLAIFYPYYPHVLTPLKALPSFLLLVLVTALCWRLRSGRPYALAGWVWYLCALVPVIGILQVGSQSSADRYTYVPSIGIFIILAWAAADLAGKSFRIRALLTAGAVVFLLVLSGVTFVQARTWHDSQSAFSNAVKVTRDNYLAHTMLGMALQKEGDLRGAADQLKEAVRLAPDYVDAWGDLGNLFKTLGKLEAAAACFQRVMALSPGDDRACMNLGLVREAQGRLDEAERCYAQVWTRNPSVARYGIQLGRIQAQQGHDQEARRSFERAAALDPQLGKPRYYLGLLDLRAGQIQRAESNLRKAAALEPAGEMAPLKLGLLLEGQGRFGEAEAEYLETLNRDANQGEAWLGLARIAAAGGRPEEARQYEARGRALLGNPPTSAPGVSPR